MKSLEVDDNIYRSCIDYINDNTSDFLQMLTPIVEKIIAETPYYIATIGKEEVGFIPFYKKRSKRGEISDESRRIARNLRSRLYVALKNGAKKGSAVKDLGCSIEEFKNYLEQKFYKHIETGEIMSWDNYGLKGWHIDHIIPLVSFDLTDREQFLKACHHTNLQPLWAEDNLRKGFRV